MKLLFVIGDSLEPKNSPCNQSIPYHPILLQDAYCASDTMKLQTKAYLINFDFAPAAASGRDCAIKILSDFQ